MRETVKKIALSFHLDRQMCSYLKKHLDGWVVFSTNHLNFKERFSITLNKASKFLRGKFSMLEIPAY